MVIITTADKCMKHLNIHLHTTYLELVLDIYKIWIYCSVSVYFPKLIWFCMCLFFFLSYLHLPTEGLLPSRGAPAVRCGEVVRFHHLLV